MIKKSIVPRHIAIIMDGNGRWARSRGLPRYAGHRQGVERVKEIVRAARELGVEALTLYAFSVENWTRPPREIDFLMRYLDRFLRSQIKDMMKNNIRLKIIGRAEPIPRRVQETLKAAQEQTSANTGMRLILAINYGSRQEIVDAVRDCVRDAVAQKVSVTNITEKLFSSYLYTAGLPDPDLLIRTSGEVRISNFLLWQVSYAEFCFVKKCWPDFHREDLVAAIENYAQRTRKYGGVDAETKTP
jgi:undecaprenyl diphosphate synthase